uniref:Uncharacterized protein n=1 Tax=Fagus sylvatica TaxID=28930 RepID=A0A2N9H8I8_FAGSY
MRGVREARNVLVSLTLICALVSVYSDCDVLNEILNEILSWCAVALAIVLLVLVLQSRMDTFRDLIREVSHRIHYEQNFKQWLQENALSDQQGKILNPEFLQILRGIGYLHHVKKRCHGNLSETNIVIVNGRAKVTGMVNDVSKTNLDDYLDYLHLATIIARCFGTNQQAIPTELELFLTYISTTKPSRLLNIENHPIFLSTLQRLCYRVISHTFLYFGKSKKSFGLALNEKLSKYNWKQKVKTKTIRMVLDRNKNLLHLSAKQRKNLKYNQSATSFMRFGRNVVVHLKDNKFDGDQGSKLTAEEVEEQLNGCWPEFMPILHQILVEHGHLMVVHDAVLK